MAYLFLLVTTSCSGGMAGSSTSLNWGGVSLSAAPARSKFDKMERLVRKGAVGRMVVAAALSLSLATVLSPTSCLHLQVVSGTVAMMSGAKAKAPAISCVQGRGGASTNGWCTPWRRCILPILKAMNQSEFVGELFMSLVTEESGTMTSRFLPSLLPSRLPIVHVAD